MRGPLLGGIPIPGRHPHPSLRECGRRQDKRDSRRTPVLRLWLLDTPNAGRGGNSYRATRLHPPAPPLAHGFSGSSLGAKAKPRDLVLSWLLAVGKAFLIQKAKQKSASRRVVGWAGTLTPPCAVPPSASRKVSYNLRARKRISHNSCCATQTAVKQTHELTVRVLDNPCALLHLCPVRAVVPEAALNAKDGHLREPKVTRHYTQHLSLRLHAYCL
eukprot:1807065-Pleurochrysis_carterae.AAC.1